MITAAAPQTAQTANWDLTAYFPEFDGPDHRAFREDYEKRLAKTLARARSLGPLRDESAGDWATLILDLEDLGARALHLFSFIHCLTAAHSKDERYQASKAALSVIDAERDKIHVRLLAALRDASDEVFEKLLAHPSLRGVEYSLRRSRFAGREMSMEPDLEELAADLTITGAGAWERLYQKIAGSLEFDLKKPDGSVERVPMARKNGLLENPNPAIRKATLEGSNAAWETVANPVAAALNAIAGERLTLQRRRGIRHFLDAATFQARISRATLDAMMEAIGSGGESMRNYLKLKAKLLGKEKLGFQDEDAPLPLKGGRENTLSWDQARETVCRAFEDAYPAMGEFARMAFEKNWIDWEPRLGKRPGAFCTSSHLIRQSRVFMTYNDTLGDAQTLAHELGHAFHNWVMRDMRPLSRSYPMTLAETASTFAEAVLGEALLNDPRAPEDDRASLLDASLRRAEVFLLNIPMRFDFEKSFHEERAKGEVSATRLRELMLQAQRARYGDALVETELDPWFWASKQHFYFTGVTFYNYPYSFGYLFSLGVFARFKKEGASFLPRYEELLRLTGSDSAEGAARRALGVELESPEFWLESIRLVEEDLSRFEEVAPRVAAGQ
jgi:oligoendopeptidase F